MSRRKTAVRGDFKKNGIKYQQMHISKPIYILETTFSLQEEGVVLEIGTKQIVLQSLFAIFHRPQHSPSCGEVRKIQLHPRIIFLSSKRIGDSGEMRQQERKRRNSRGSMDADFKVSSFTKGLFTLLWTSNQLS